MCVVSARGGGSAALQILVSGERFRRRAVVIFITGSGIKYLECYEG